MFRLKIEKLEVYQKNAHGDIEHYIDYVVVFVGEYLYLTDEMQYATHEQAQERLEYLYDSFREMFTHDVPTHEMAREYR